jgi:hypothetical protein
LDIGERQTKALFVQYSDVKAKHWAISAAMENTVPARVPEYRALNPNFRPRRDQCESAGKPDALQTLRAILRRGA